MKTYAISGVKGGVGKTTFAILLSLKLSENKKVVLCDCDVECPNDYLLLKQELKDSNPIYREVPELIKEKCKKCGICSKTCKENAIFWIPNQYPKFIHNLCIGCGACKIVCPFNAIRMKKVEIGNSFVNKIKNNLFLVTGIAKPNISETGPIVREVKKRAIELAKKIGADYVILDVAAGTHCNVIQALINTDKIYAVTEPTPLGKFDLEIMLELAKKLGIETEVVINKYGIGKEKEIEEIAKKYGSRVGIKIPYSEKIIEAYMNKELEKVVDLIKW